MRSVPYRSRLAAVLIGLLVVARGPTTPQAQTSQESLRRALCARAPAAVHRAVQQLAAHGSQLRLDVVSLLRFIDGAWPPSGAGAALARAAPAAHKDPTYPLFREMVEAGFRRLPSRRLAPDRSPVPPDPSTFFDEGRSDQCLGAALRCETSADCLSYEIDLTRGGYVLSHQALYFLFAKLKRCRWKTDVDRELDRLVGRMYREQDAATEFTDLFAERMGIGAFSGQLAFLRPSWIERILSEQQPEGCWHASPVKDRCNDHTTGMAAWVLALFLGSKAPQGCR